MERSSSEPGDIGDWEGAHIGSTSDAIANRGKGPEVVVPDGWQPDEHRDDPVLLGVDWRVLGFGARQSRWQLRHDPDDHVRKPRPVPASSRRRAVQLPLRALVAVNRPTRRQQWDSARLRSLAIHPRHDQGESGQTSAACLSLAWRQRRILLPPNNPFEPGEPVDHT